jgi:microcystin-dependent protein
VSLGTLTAKYETGLGSISGQEYYNWYVNTDTGVTDPATHTHTVGNTGSGSSHENRPPYYALAYIMKI